MLTTLTIRNVVLIEQVSLHLHKGLCVMTGETGAGKSILLDALGLALGARAENRLVRAGSDGAVVTAAFDTDDKTFSTIKPLLDDQGIPFEGDLILRRMLSPDGRSKAFINDTPVSVGLLKTVGESLIEIHGQFETATLLNPVTHRSVLDSFAENGALTSKSATAYHTWQDLKQRKAALETEIVKARNEEDYLRSMVEELDKLSPQEGEEEELSQKRSLMMHGEKLVGALQSATNGLNSESGAQRGLFNALNALEAVQDKADGKIDEPLEALNRASVEIEEALATLEGMESDFDFDANAQDAIEQRLFDLKAAARKHHTTVDMLPSLRDEYAQKLQLIGDNSQMLDALDKETTAAKLAFIEVASMLHEKREKSAHKLDNAVMAELTPLKLDKATFSTRVERIENEAEWSEHGFSRIAFEVATNPGAAPGPLNKIASGGELARFMLAIKVILSRTSTVPVMVFDEVDSGIGGATAHAVGERLQRLGQDVQVLVITHSPQVAARGSHHFNIHKVSDQDHTQTNVTHLCEFYQRREEIARMLAGRNVTNEARAAADTLLQDAQETMNKTG